MIIEKINSLYSIKSENGLYLTTFKDGDDIKKFYASKVIYATNPSKIKKLREITNNEYTKYIDEMEKALLEEIEALKEGGE